MDQNERQRVLDRFASSEAQLLMLADGLTPEQWAFQEDAGRWSIAGILEHVIAVETRITRAIARLIEKPSERAERPDPTSRDDALWANLTNRAVKLEAPAPVHPTGKFATPAELVNEFQATRARSVAFAGSTDADLRGYIIPHIAFGDLDLYQWLIVLCLHGSRHALQIEEIKAAPAFPR